jgi:hypothetical protein
LLLKATLDLISVVKKRLGSKKSEDNLPE